MKERQVIKNLDGKRFRADIFNNLESSMNEKNYTKLKANAN